MSTKTGQAHFRKEMQVFQADETRTVALMPPGAGLEADIQPGGTLLQTANFEPSAAGTIVYFDPAEAMETVLKRVEAAGGKVTFPRFRIGNGYLATFMDYVYPNFSHSTGFGYLWTVSPVTAKIWHNMIN